ncbi:conjugal transfer protein [Alkalihalobacillus sp. TS-13]|uniref:conjugal transfer protein n=1 Tax=Alkalihalobacillus sp. TS-13 TaxID=2842455 RepID=UPI001C8797C6|nr:conjugal transfer protein [Alkalihalobacillus sp. TS-13]
MKKRKYPQTVLRKKVIKGLFWTGFTLVLCLSIVAIVQTGNAGVDAHVQKPEPKEEKEDNLAASVGAQTFAENFASHYFYWKNTEEFMKIRAKRLEPFLATGLEEQAGLVFEGMKWNSKLASSQIWKVEETGSDTAEITLRIKQALFRTIQPDKKAITAAKKAKKKPPKPKVKKAGPYERYFVVPVKTDGESFVVHKIPHYVTAPEKPDITVGTEIDEEEIVSDPQLQKQITTFLNTFFKVYTTGTQDELYYYFNGDSIQSMKEILTFKEVKEVILKEGEGTANYTVFTTVVYTEFQSKAQVVYPYEMNIVQEEGRWFVKSIKIR